MSEVTPTQDELSDIDQLYRRLSALDQGRPGEWVRRKVQAYATQQAAERAVRDTSKAKESPVSAPTPKVAPTSHMTAIRVQEKKSWALPAALGGVAVVALAAFLVVPRLMTSHTPTATPPPAPPPVSQLETEPSQVTPAPAEDTRDSTSSPSAPSAAPQEQEAPASPPPAAQAPTPPAEEPPVVAHSSPPATPVTASSSAAGTFRAQASAKARAVHQNAPTPANVPVAPGRAASDTRTLPPPTRTGSNSAQVANNSAPPPSPNTATVANNSAPVVSSPPPVAPSTPAPNANIREASAVQPPPAASPPTTQPAPMPAPAAAKSNPPDELYQAAESGDLGQLQDVLTGTFDVNVPDAKGRKALILAIQRGHIDAVKVLLAHGANPNAPDSHGTTPMGAAYSRGNLEIENALRRSMRH